MAEQSHVAVLQSLESRWHGLSRLGAFVCLAAAIGAGCSERKEETVSPVSRQRAAVSEQVSEGPAAESGEAVEPSTIYFATVSDSGIDFRHITGTSAEKPFPAANGSGIAALDFDLDGNYDLYFATGTPFPIDLTRREPINRLFQNMGQWQFRDVTAQAGLGFNGYTAGLAVGDYDSDGFPDVYVTCYGKNWLYRNQGDGTFRRLDESHGASDERWATSAAFLDYDNDGLLDIYVCNYGEWSLETNQFCGDPARNIRVYCNPRSVPPQRDTLLHNEGDGTFRDATAEAGLADRAGRGQGVVAADINDDGLVDLYLGNDLHANSLFVNNGNGRFTDATEISGVAYDARGNSQAGMGVDAADVNLDGRTDLFVTNFQGEYNAFYENLGQGVFQDLSQSRGLAHGSLPWVGWGTMLVDFDLDGWPDVVVTNGHVDDNLHELGQDGPYQQPPLVWRNERGRFALQGPACGPYFQQRHVGRGLAVADLDNDGDQDVVISHQDGPPALLRNMRRDQSDADSLRVRLIGTSSNRDAVGSRLTLVAGRRATQQIKGGGSYLSAHDLRQIMAVLPEDGPLRLEITWPSGRRSEVTGIAGGDDLVIREPMARDQDPGDVQPLRPASQSSLRGQSPIIEGAL